MYSYQENICDWGDKMDGKYDVEYLHDRLNQDQPNAKNDQLICFIQHRNLTTKSIKKFLKDAFESKYSEILSLDCIDDIISKPESNIELPNNFMYSEDQFTGFKPGLIIDLKSKIRSCKVLKEPLSISMKIIKDRKRNK